MISQLLDFFIKKRHSVGILYGIFALLSFISLIASFAQGGNVTSAQGTCDPGVCSLESDVCDSTAVSLMAPFAFEVITPDCTCGTMQCGWTNPNYALRGTIVFFSFFTGLHGLLWVFRPPIGYRNIHFSVLTTCLFTYSFVWFSLFILDSNSISRGGYFCDAIYDDIRKDIDLLNLLNSIPVRDVTCKAGHFVFVGFLDVFLFINAALLTGIMYRSVTSDAEEGNKDIESGLGKANIRDSITERERGDSTLPPTPPPPEPTPPPNSAVPPISAIINIPKNPIIVNAPSYSSDFRMTESEQVLYSSNSLLAAGSRENSPVPEKRASQTLEVPFQSQKMPVKNFREAE